MDSILLFQPIAAPADAVWRACSTERGLAGWQADVVSGTPGPGADLRFEWPQLHASMRVRVDEVHPGRALQMRHEGTRLRLTLTDGGVSLAVSGLPTFDTDAYRSSWALALAQLAHHVEHHADAARRVHWASATCRSSPEAAYLAFSDWRGMANWLELSPTPARRVFDREGFAMAWAPQVDDAPLLVLRALATNSPDELLLLAGWSDWGQASPNTDFCGRLEAGMRRLSHWLKSPGAL